MLSNCSKEFYEEHMKRYRRMNLLDVLKEYDAIVSVLDMDCSNDLMCLDELISWEDMIRDYCLELVRVSADKLNSGSNLLMLGCPLGEHVR